MSTDKLPVSEDDAEQRTQKIRHDLQRLGQRDWSMWGSAAVVILSLTAGVASFFGSEISHPDHLFYQFQSEAVHSLFGLVLLFGVYTLYQQLYLRRARIQLAEQIEIAAQQQERAEEFLKLAMLDPLTGLHNRRFGEERLAAEITRAERSGGSLILLMLDLDDFKRINDQHGHGVGDSALKMFAACLMSATRGSDLAVRLGGDEFLVLLPACQRGQVQHVLNRLAPLVLSIGKEKISLEFSSGWADYQLGETAQHLLKRADDALYAQKEIRSRSCRNHTRSG
jgi:diguanylate cyclase (GGDEF)-like protein